MAEVSCEVSEGLRPSEATVAVRDVYGRQQFLRVERDFLAADNGRWLLPVGVVFDDRSSPSVLVELPHEADSGANRLWVPRENLRRPSKTAV
jgi:hypothetical protein